jgi:excisionase family DNA binding protein
MARTKASSERPTKKPSTMDSPPNGSAKSFEVLTLTETADYLRVSPEEVLQLITAEGLPGRKFGTDWRFLKAALRDWLSMSTKKKGLQGQLGKIKDDPYFQQMLQEIYDRRGRAEISED